MKSIKQITPVILAGGSGTRLWPLSRKDYPKQFVNLIGEKSLFQETILRLTSSEKLEFSPSITITSEDYRFIIGDQFSEIDSSVGSILIEPESKNTAPAILAASLYAKQKNPDSIVLIAPSDHAIPDIEAFHAAVISGYSKASEGKIVTFGIQPNRPETGYGYMEILGKSEKQPIQVCKFIEKPDLETAKKMLETGQYLWNAGIFMFKADTILKAFEDQSPNILRLVKTSLDEGKADLNFFRLKKSDWKELESISFDHLILEKMTNIFAVPLNQYWSDLGDWEAVGAEIIPDENGNALSTNATSIKCQNSVIRSESENQHVVGVGLEDMIVVAMRDAVLVSKKDRSQNIKEVVEHLKTQKVAQAEKLLKDHRPWGWFESLVLAGRFQVKRLMVKPGAALSLQSHHHRSEHWVVVEGTARVTVDEASHLITEGESIFIPLGSKHRLENPGKLPMILIEIQTGPYLREDDIIRYDDIYARS
ncbi:mannose-1-phosphate guanylyltransferase/mannose-6-phosphate isomerase [Paracoccaceae bacterium]|nr:mannose-1-phosphate guanylyltransferase/mannose-6-phosphate isomerase [Paracoccaceae bacterium]